MRSTRAVGLCPCAFSDWERACCQVARKGKTSVSTRNKDSPFYKAAWPKSVPLGEDDLPQREAKRFLPTGGHVWRDNARGAWAYHHEGHKRFSIPWSRFGGNSRLSMFEGMRVCWKLFLQDKCLPESACPIEGMFAGGDP